jgi:hypothetical protein
LPPNRCRHEPGPTKPSTSVASSSDHAASRPKNARHSSSAVPLAVQLVNVAGFLAHAPVEAGLCPALAAEVRAVVEVARAGARTRRWCGVKGGTRCRSANDFTRGWRACGQTVRSLSVARLYRRRQQVRVGDTQAEGMERPGLSPEGRPVRPTTTLAWLYISTGFAPAQWDLSTFFIRDPAAKATASFPNKPGTCPAGNRPWPVTSGNRQSIL